MVDHYALLLLAHEFPHVAVGVVVTRSIANSRAAVLKDLFGEPARPNFLGIAYTTTCVTYAIKIFH